MSLRRPPNKTCTVLCLVFKRSSLSSSSSCIRLCSKEKERLLVYCTMCTTCFSPAVVVVVTHTHGYNSHIIFLEKMKHDIYLSSLFNDILKSGSESRILIYDYNTCQFFVTQIAAIDTSWYLILIGAQVIGYILHLCDTLFLLVFVYNTKTRSHHPRQKILVRSCHQQRLSHFWNRASAVSCLDRDHHAERYAVPHEDGQASDRERWWRK